VCSSSSGTNSRRFASTKSFSIADCRLSMEKQEPSVRRTMVAGVQTATGNPKSAEAGAADRLAEILAFHSDDPAHFVQARPHALANAVPQALYPGGATRASQRPRRGIGEVRGDDRGAVVVIAGIENQTDRVPHPLRGFDRAEFVQNQDFGIEHRAQNFKFSGTDRVVVGILYLLQQFAVVVKEAGDVLAENQFSYDAHGEVGLTHADTADQKQAGVVHRVLFHKLAGCHARRSQAAMWSIEFEIRELAMFITFGNARSREQGVGARLLPARTARHSPLSAIRDRLPSCARAKRTSFHYRFHVSGFSTLL